jgi:hypothetical protein
MDQLKISLETQELVQRLEQLSEWIIDEIKEERLENER